MAGRFSLLLFHLLLLASLLLPLLAQPSPIYAHWSFASLASDSSTAAFTANLGSPTEPAPTPSSSSLSPPLLVGPSCPFPPCASFTSANPYAQILSVSPPLGFLGAQGAPIVNHSVALWVNPQGEANTVWEGLLGAWGYPYKLWSFRLYGNQPCLLWYWLDATNTTQEGAFYSTVSVPYGAWTHVALSYSTADASGVGQLTLYLNGSQTDAWTLTNAVYVEPTAATPNWEVGGIEDANFGYLGLMDELWIFSIPLTRAEVLLLINLNTIGSCSPGSFGYGGYATCARCPAGSYSDSIGAVECTTCPAGTYSGLGATACQACPPGFFSDASNSTGCTACPAGTYCPTPGLNASLPCPAGSYSTNTSTACSYCPANSTTAPGATSAAQCTACPTNSTGGGTVPVCCPRGVSASGALLAQTSAMLSAFAVSNACILYTDVTQATGVVEQLGDYCGVGYDVTLTQSMQALYTQFSAWQQPGTAAVNLTAVYCN